MRSMKKFKLRFLAAAVALVAALPCAVSPAFANSGKRSEFGVTGTGVIVKNEQSALAVESEKLTFDIVDYPEYPNVDGYKSTVTAEYTFVNTSDIKVVTSMAFPIGTDPSCYGDVADPQIKVNGDIVPVVTRHTFGSYSSYNDFSQRITYLSDELYEDDFYKPDMTVTRFTVDVDTTKDKDYRCVGKYSCDPSRARIIGSAYDGEIIEWANGKEATKENVDNRSFYIVGDASAFSCDWHTEKYVPSFRINSCYSYTSGSYKKTNVGVTVSETGKTTLKELVLTSRKADSVVSETDWYNGLMNAFFQNVKDARAAQYSDLRQNDERFTAWYTYDVEVEPGGKVVNSVTAPILPSLRYGYDPYRYDYEYYLSPAKSWKSFGTLEVNVNTDYFMVEAPEGFEKCEGGYKATFNSLPDGELKFNLCSVEEPKYVGYHKGGISWATLVVIFIILGCFFGVSAVIALIVVIISVIRSHKKNKNMRN